MFDMSFAYPYTLLLLLLLPAAGWWRWHRRNRPGTVRHADVRLLRLAKPGAWSRLWRLPDALRLLALSALIVALARPQTPDVEVLSGDGVDIMIALDMSGSMNAVDMSRDKLQELLSAGTTPKNRFEVARETLQEFVGNRREDRVGLVVFGEKAFLKFPLTLDYTTVIDLLKQLVLDSGERDREDGECLNNCSISGAGTAIGDALSRAYRRLQGATAKSRVIVLITDGKNEGGEVQPKTIADYIAERPADEQVRIYTFLVGNSEETYVPVRNVFGQTSYQPPQRPFPTDPELLQYLAEKTGGKFYDSYDEAKFKSDFADLTKTTFETKTFNREKDVFAPFVLAGFALLLLEWALRFLVFRKFP
jgi:Ca-activated chloride channel family protein